MKQKIRTTIILFILALNLSCSQQNENRVQSDIKSFEGENTYQQAIQLLSNIQLIYSQIVQKVIPSIVSIRVVSSDYRMFYGTGVIIEDTGLILTSEHIISQAGEIDVVLHNRELYFAKIVGCDYFTDLAVIKIDDAENLKKIEFADSDAVQIGNLVFSFGNTFGISFTDGQPSVISGIVSALERVASPNGNDRMYWGTIQHDCAVNPGNSGGPLCDIQGKMIGLNGVISSNTGSSSGVSFAIPINSIKNFLPNLINGIKIIHPYLGLSNLENVVNQSNEKVGIRGVRVGAVIPNSPASQSNIIAGDIILNADNQKICDKAELLNWLSKKKQGDVSSFQMLRVDEKTHEGVVFNVEITIGIRPD